MTRYHAVVSPGHRRTHPLLELLSALPPMVQFAAIGLLALLFRLIVLDQIRTDPHLADVGGDGQAYLKWAHTIVGGEWIGHEVFYPSPLYPYLVAVFYKFISTKLETLLTFHAILGAVGCGLLALATRKLLDPISGWIAGLLLAFYPAAISYDLQIDKTVLDPPLLAATLLFVAMALHRPLRRGWFACGVTLGVFSLTRENALALAVPIIAWLWWAFREHSRRQRTILSAAMLLGIFLAIFPVCLRNSLLGGGFYLSTAKFGANFYYGNCAQADGVYFPLKPDRGDLRYEQKDAVDIAEQSLGHPLSIGEVSHWWTQRTLDDIKAAPARWAWLSVKKFAMFFCDTEIADADVHERHIVYSPLMRGLDHVWGFRIVMILAAGGAVLLFRSHGRIVILLLAMTLTYASAIAVFILFGRYRLPAVPMMLPLAAGGLAALPEVFRERRWKEISVAAVASCFAAALVWSGDRVIPQRIAGANPYNRANLFAENHQRELAVASYRQAIHENPQLAAAYSNLSLQLTELNRLDEAETSARLGVELDGSNAAAHTDLGLVLARQQRWPDAIAEFREALRIDPAEVAAQQNLKLIEKSGVTQIR